MIYLNLPKNNFLPFQRSVTFLDIPLVGVKCGAQTPYINWDLDNDEGMLPSFGCHNEHWEGPI